MWRNQTHTGCGYAEILSKPAFTSGYYGIYKMSQAQPALELVDIHKSYGDLAVIKGISLKANDGDVISILGSSGSGKSTLLRCINLLEHPNAGRIIVAGEELALKPGKDGYLDASSRAQLESMRSRIGLDRKSVV